MSRFSPCSGSRPFFLTNLSISSKPAIIRCSRAERLLVCATSPLTPRSLSNCRSSSVTFSAIVPLRCLTLQKGHTFCHSFLPRIDGGQRRQTPFFLFESESSLG